MAGSRATVQEASYRGGDDGIASVTTASEDLTTQGGRPQKGSRGEENPGRGRWVEVQHGETVIHTGSGRKKKKRGRDAWDSR
jgi:hypothetical protein